MPQRKSRRWREAGSVGNNLLQSSWKKPEPDEKQQKEDAAMKIQKVQRGNASRKLDQEKKHAATKIQALERGRQCRQQLAAEQLDKPEPDEKQQKEDAAMKIQKVQRGNASRKLDQEKKHAATKIQALERGRQCRQQLAAEQLDKQEQEEAAIKIQKLQTWKSLPPAGFSRTAAEGSGSKKDSILRERPAVPAATWRRQEKAERGCCGHEDSEDTAWECLPQTGSAKTRGCNSNSITWERQTMSPTTCSREEAKTGTGRCCCEDSEDTTWKGRPQSCRDWTWSTTQRREGEEIVFPQTRRGTGSSRAWGASKDGHHGRWEVQPFANLPALSCRVQATSTAQTKSSRPCPARANR